jgi:hypothetical protein
MVRKQKGNAELAMLVGVVIFIIGVVIALKLQEMADAVRLDLHSMFLVAVGVGILSALGLWSLRDGWFRRFACYLPFGMLLCLVPALNFWCWEFIIPPHNGVWSLFQQDQLMATRESPLWYGQTWLQGLSLLATAALGYVLDHEQ